LSPSSQDRLLRLRHLAISARCRWLRRRRGLFLLRQNQLHGQLRDHIYFKRRHTFATADWFRSIPMAVSTCSSTSAQGNRLFTVDAAANFMAADFAGTAFVVSASACFTMHRRITLAPPRSALPPCMANYSSVSSPDTAWPCKEIRQCVHRPS
jgi:hypothetical protein